MSWADDCELEYLLNDLKEENTKLRDENVRLRSCLSDDVDNARQIMAESAKLRELAEILMPMVMRSQRYCSHICDVREQCVSLVNPVYGCIKRKDIMNRADKLGIEVCE